MAKIRLPLVGAMLASSTIVLSLSLATNSHAATTGYTEVNLTSASGKCATKMEVPDSRPASGANISVIDDGNFCVVVDKNFSTDSPLKFDRWIKPAGVESVEYVLVGGGGAGGTGASCSSCGGGAGGQFLTGSISTSSRSFLAILAGYGSGEASRSSSLGSCIASESIGVCPPTSGTALAQLLAHAYGGPNGASNNATTTPAYGGGGGAVTGVGGTPPIGSGYKGGNGFSGGGAGGGSGACGAGQNANATSGGAGGVGCTSSITGSLAFYGVGGGGAGKCTTCVGGAAPNSSGVGGSASRPLGYAGVAPYFGSGGGGTYSGSPAKGGGGVVILRYASVQPPVWTDSSVAFGTACSRVVSDGVSATGTAPMTYAVVAGGVLPKGLTFKSDGTGFTGTPEPSTYNFTLSASNAAGTIYTQPFSSSLQACADVGIDSVTGPGTIAPGDTKPMTFVLANRAGPDDAPDATFTFRVPDNVTATPRGFECTGTTTLTCSKVGAIPRSATASASDRTLIFDVTVSSSFVGSTTSNGACSVATSAAETNTANNSAVCNFAVSAASADIQVISWPGANEKTTYAPNSTGSRSFKIENFGPSDAANPTFTFTVGTSNIQPTGTYTPITSGSTAGTWTCTPATPSTTLTCSSSTPMAKGSWIIIKVDTQADNSANGTQVTSTATVSTSTSDPVSGNNSLSTMLMFVDLRPDLNIRAVYDNPVLVPGTSTKLRIQVANGGSIGSSGPTTVTFALPSGLSLVNGDSVPATCSASGANVTCSSASGLAIPGGLVEFVLPVSLIESATPGNSLSLTATAGTATTTDSNASGNESNTSNNAVTVALTVGPATVDLAVTATRPPKTDAGATAVVLMTITNNGPSDSAGGYSLRYDLPQKVSLSGALPSGCAQSGASITCTRGTAFAKAATDTYSITVIVDSATLSGLTIGGAIEVTTQAVESALSNNAVTVTAANLDVNGLTPPTTTTTTSTTTTTVAPTTTVPKPVKKKAIPDTGFSTNDFLVASMWAVLLGAFLVDLSRRRRLRQI
jgi:hypothetical protein